MIVMRLACIAHRFVSSNSPTRYASAVLERQDGRRLETKVSYPEVPRNLLNQTLEGELTDQKIGVFLVLADRPECDSPGAVAVGFLDSAGVAGASLRAFSCRDACWAHSRASPAVKLVLF